MRPFLKWAGNKFQIMQHLLEKLPKRSRLLEPFVGSGAVFLNTSYDSYLLADNNKDLITLYQTLQIEQDVFIDYCRQYFTKQFNCESAYYRLRDEFNETDDPPLRAALFLYFNKHGYNGLCRYNRNGGFNVPFGRYTKPYFPEKEMRFFLVKAKHAKFIHQDFTNTLDHARSGDVIYCDPPYAPLSNTAKFTTYSPGGFGIDQHVLLANKARALARQGIIVVISNHNTNFIQETYRPAQMMVIEVPRFISCNPDKRHKVEEVIAIFQ